MGDHVLMNFKRGGKSDERRGLPSFLLFLQRV